MGTLLRTREIDRLIHGTDPADDTELLRRYREAGDSEALECIVRRHARTVLGVCRRILTDPHAAEDAFQATFLQFVRSARSLHSPAALAAWLYATARRTALRHRRPVPEPPVPEPPVRGQNPLDALSARELLHAIEREITRLPEVYRLPLVLCYLDGLTKGEAADRLGLPAGVLRGRLDRGREKLRLALVRRGFAPVTVIGLLVPTAGSVSAELVSRTLGICARAEPIPAAVALLAAGRTGVLPKVALAVGVLLLGGLGLIAATGRIEPPATPPGSTAPPSAGAESRRDLYGDPLPPGAIARIGSIRWRHRDESHTITSAVPSPNGQFVATRTFVERGTGCVRVWELSDGKPVCEIPWEHTFSDLAFTPDGSRLVILLPRGVVRTYDPRTGKLLTETKPAAGPDRADWPQKMTGDGRWVVTDGEKGTRTLTEVRADPVAEPHRVTLEAPPGGHERLAQAQFAVDGNTLVGYRADLLFLRWDTRTGQLVRTTSLKTKWYGVCVGMAPDGKRFATWQYGVKPRDTLLIWDTETGTPIAELEGGDRNGYGSIRFSPDGKRVAAEVQRTDTSATVKVWELERGKEIGRVQLPDWCYSYALLPDGKTLLAASHWGMMFGTWDTTTGRRLSPVTGHESDIRHLAFTADGKTVLTASGAPGERVTAWDAATGQKRQELTAPHGPGSRAKWPGPSASFVLTPGGAVVTTEKGTLIWTDTRTGRELKRVAPQPIAAALDPYDCFQEERVSLTHDPRTGRPAVLGLHSFGPSPFLSHDPKHKWKDVVTLWDAESGELLDHRGHARGHHSGAGVISPDGRLLVRPSYDSPAGGAIVLDSALGGRGSFQLKQPDDLLLSALFSPDGQTLVTVTRARGPETSANNPVGAHTVRLWEVRSGKPRLEFAVPFVPSALAVSPDGRFLAGERTDKKSISVWDLATGTGVAERSGYRSLIWTLAFRPDGKALASGHADGTALVWDLSGVRGAKPGATDREAAWKDLASADAGKAFRAVTALAAEPGGVAFLRDRVKPVAVVPAARVQKLVQDLGADEFRTREAATDALTKLGDAVDAELRVLLRGDLSLEQRRRIGDALASRRLTESDPECLRELRCVEVLERVGSAEARSVLRELARGTEGAKFTREATGALWRLTSHTVPGQSRRSINDAP